MTNREKTIKKIIAYFEENNDIFNECIIQLDDYNGYLGDDRFYDMDLLNEIYSGVEPLEILRRAFFGHDEDNWHTDSHGNKEYASFNPNRDYYKYNGYGNLISTDYPDYAFKLGEAVTNKIVDYGIAICGSAIGISIACNKVKGIRCICAQKKEDVERARQHVNVNVLAFAAEETTASEAMAMVEKTMNTQRWSLSIPNAIPVFLT
mgnify:CR=1 FL=1